MCASACVRAIRLASRARGFGARTSTFGRRTLVRKQSTGSYRWQLAAGFFKSANGRKPGRRLCVARLCALVVRGRVE